MPAVLIAAFNGAQRAGEQIGEEEQPRQGLIASCERGGHDSNAESSLSGPEAVNTNP